MGDGVDVTVSEKGASLSVPRPEYIYQGHNACPGCAAALCMRYVLKALGSKTAMVIAPSCWTILAGMHPHYSLKIPVAHCLFASCAAVASGLSRGLQVKGDKETTVVGWAGDGGTFDIGIQAISGAAEKNENFLYVCYDNEAYMNTGVQRSSATPYKARTTTTPAPYHKLEFKKDFMEIIAAHNVPYAATATVGYPEDFLRKVNKAKEVKGFRFLHLLTPCPTGWAFDTHLTVEISRLAVESKVFNLYEVENGVKYTINYRPEKEVTVKDYIKDQRRFRFLEEEDIDKLQKEVDAKWQRLLMKERLSAS